MMNNTMNLCCEPILRFPIRILSVIVAAAMLFSCSGGGEGASTADDGTPVKGDWIVVHLLSDPEGLNPLITNDASSSAIFNHVYEKLLDYDFETT
ncbi:MAG TPA: hypothetical protein DCZ59_08025, partial [Bacteroidetes bacterium]|nr:hypothetical protein [Bacteroidota bacterium]